jgi:CheY-like chemotaxis protein
MHILLVDDEKLNRMVVGRVLQNAGYDFHSCADGEEALEYLKRTRCDLVLMDWELRWKPAGCYDLNLPPIPG